MSGESSYCRAVRREIEAELAKKTRRGPYDTPGDYWCVKALPFRATVNHLDHRYRDERVPIPQRRKNNAYE